jgi:hypothetical protein
MAKLSPSLSQSTLVAAIADARKVEIYEGLPNSEWDPSFKTESSRDDIVRFHAVPFYAPAQTLKNEDFEAIAAFLKGPFPAVGAKFLPPKQCGDFHADFCVVFSSGAKKVGVMFCFTCADLVAFTDEAFWLVGIEKNPGLEVLKKTVFHYHSKRPPERTPNQALQPTAAAGRG